MDDHEESITIGGRAERTNRPAASVGSDALLLNIALTFTFPQGSKIAQFFPDGTPVVSGFTASNDPVVEDKW